MPRVIKVLGIMVAVVALYSCQPLRYSISNRDIQREIRKSSLFENQFTGFSLFDPVSKEYLCNYNDHLPFTPASNTKILTTLACLEALEDSIPSFAYSTQGDSIYLSPLADPSFLHPKFDHQPAVPFLRDKIILLSYPKTSLRKFGSGWAWDDYEYSFQPERSWFPIYGNAVRIYNEGDSMKIVPSFFKDYTQIITGERPGNLIYRWQHANIFNAWVTSDTAKYERKIPFVTSDELLTQLLRDTLHSKVYLTDSIKPLMDTLYSQSTRFTLAMMMLPSDNFLAEHLLLQCALRKGYASVDHYRSAMTKRWSSFLPDSMRWVDGSGLSRYNLISPRNMVAILNQIYNKASWNEITAIFPTGGVSGTIKSWYAADEPYVFAKTGTLSNNHNLSGYIKTKSGRILIFSFMNNHYLTSTTNVKLEMQELLSKIRDAY